MKLRYPLRQLQIFREVVHTGSLSKAARRLDLSQPAVSSAIANLEQEAGFLLFRRNNYGTELTPEARYLMEGVDRVLASVSHLDELAEGLRQGRAGKLIVGCMPGLSPSALPQIMADYLSDFPDTRLSLQTFSSGKIRDWVAEGQFDVGVIERQDDLSDLEVKHLTLRMHLAVPANSPLATATVVGAKDLDGMPLITLDEHHQSTLKLKQALRQADARWHVAAETHLFPSAISLVRAGIGHALVDPVSAAGFLLRRDCDVAIVPFEPAIDLEIAIITPRFHPSSRQCQRFLPYLEKGLAHWHKRALAPLHA
ncbi:LysR family transcriptional regulator [Halomonas denitrificans]|uniref:LysR family transcriptional regulator n=1 Tax=Halomonas TaxID=2745 RepID=UPI001A8CFF9A|nr:MULTISPECIES: LysR family transcriptional regulator [Halomonas]MED5295000.1 LysR family transcriptional regulator [Pseudomonadota bacterium]MBN8413225.1 LysR family transcriptional regulator [Halomonas litopenaei]MBY5924203.1 LysR family transcriptional regulator [Halomonas sp. DP4Y7-2]MBY5928371.1 LysR family transcriptional regulator [Halomonas sp. DP8Y7-3]MBY5967095.1 LysR family transcriptional regulator [Halomonas denitrificans]